MNNVTAFIKRRQRTATDKSDGEDGRALLKIMRETVVRDGDGMRVAMPKRARYKMD